MPRKNLIRSSVYPYHVVNRTNHRERFPISSVDAWSEFQHFCWEADLIHGARIHAFVMMSNHFHLLLSTPASDLGTVMEFFAGNIARSINEKSNRKGHLFSGRYKWSLIRHPTHFMHVLKYVYRNPVKAGIVQRVEDYSYSSIYGLTGQAHIPFPILLPHLELGCNEFEIFSPKILNWLNQPSPKEQQQIIKNALCKSEFTIPMIRTTRREKELEVIPD